MKKQKRRDALLKFFSNFSKNVIYFLAAWAICCIFSTLVLLLIFGEDLKLTKLTQKEKDYYSTISSNIWFNGIYSLNTKEIKELNITYTNDAISVTYTDNAISGIKTYPDSVYEEGLSSLDYDNINIMIKFDSFYMKQTGNTMKFYSNDDRKYNAKVICSDSEIKITIYDKPDDYYLIFISFGCLIGSAFVCLIYFLSMNINSK